MRFLVINYLSLYNYIMGRPTQAEMIVVPSMVHLKMKFYTKRAHVATNHGEISAVRRCFNAASKGKTWMTLGYDLQKGNHLDNNDYLGQRTTRFTKG